MHYSLCFANPKTGFKISRDFQMSNRSSCAFRKSLLGAGYDQPVLLDLDRRAIC